MVAVVLVEPKIPGNIGAIARVMMNFGFLDLRMVNPCELDDSAFARAMHAKPLLKDAAVYEDLESAISDRSLVIGTTAVINENFRNKIRNPLTPQEFFEDTEKWDDNAAILFGSEDIGLKEDALRRCDVLLSIPASDEYWVMNLSHAVGIILYELARNFGMGAKDRGTHLDTMGRRELVSMKDREIFVRRFRDLMESCSYQDHKRANAEVTLRRLLGKAAMTEEECTVLIGVLSRAIKSIELLEEAAGIITPRDEVKKNGT